MKSIVPDFEAWVVFAKVVEHGSFTAAADALGLSNGTASKAVSRLEKRLGVTLFHRTTRTLTLTPIGSSLAGRAAALLSHAEEAENAARDEGAEPHGLVRIAAPMSFGISHVAPMLPRLAVDLPGVSVNLDLDDAPVDLVAKGVDIAVRIGWLSDSGLKARKLGEVRSQLVAAPSYIARSGAPARPEQLADHATLTYAHVRPHHRWALEHVGGERIQVDVRNLLVTNSGEAMLPLLRAGVAVALVPDFMIQNDVRRGTLVQILPGWGLRPAGLHLVTPTSGPRPSRVIAVLDFLARNLTLRDPL
jgi:DNA-binding transcriptional LysR family regulator